MENTAFNRIKEVVLRLMVDANALAMQHYSEIEKFTYKNTRDIVTRRMLKSKGIFVKG